MNKLGKLHSISSRAKPKKKTPKCKPSTKKNKIPFFNIERSAKIRIKCMNSSETKHKKKRKPCKKLTSKIVNNGKPCTTKPSEITTLN